jgi:hypothetical protein
MKESTEKFITQTNMNNTGSHNESGSGGEFIIYECFKSMMNKSKCKDKRSVSSDINLKNIENMTYNNYNLCENYKTDSNNDHHDNERIFASSMIQDLEDMEYNNSNNNHHSRNNIEINVNSNKQSFFNENNFYFTPRGEHSVHPLDNDMINSQQTFNQINTNKVKSIPYEAETNLNNVNNITNMSKSNGTKCKNSICLFYRKKFRHYKKTSENYKRKYLKQKKLAELLNLKLFYETHKNNAENTVSTATDKLPNTPNSINKITDEEKLTKMLYDKLQENIILFEKLENEIINKDAIIQKQNETIKHQKGTIDKLLEQFKIFLNQGNYLINDILLLKQSMYDKNITDVAKEFDEVSLGLSEYTRKIKEFTEKKEVPSTNSSKNIENEKINTYKRLNTIEEIEMNNESEISFDLTKSNVNKKSTSNVISAVNNDRSLNLLDLSNTNAKYLMSSQFHLNYSESEILND